MKHRQDMFREVVRRFMREELVPQQKAFEEAGQPTREVWRALGKMVCCSNIVAIRVCILLTQNGTFSFSNT